MVENYLELLKNGQSIGNRKLEVCLESGNLVIKIFKVKTFLGIRIWTSLEGQIPFPTSYNSISKYFTFVQSCIAENPMDDEVLDVLHACVGLSGEVGEVLDEIKKVVFHSKPRDEFKLKSESGDVLFYFVAFLLVNKFSMEDIMEYNIKKIKDRYPNGRDRNFQIRKKEDPTEILKQKID